MSTMADLTTRVKSLVGTFTHKKFAEELAEIQRTIENLQAEQAALHEKNLALAAENVQLKQAIALLEGNLKREPESGAQQDIALDEICEKILIDISNNETPKDSIIRFFQLTKAKGDEHFDVLAARKFIRVKYTLDDDIYYVLTDEGQRYLENK